MVFLYVSHFDDHTVVNFASVWHATVLLLVHGDYTVVNVTTLWSYFVLVILMTILLLTLPVFGM